jgi:hypothetical protein
MARAIYRLHNVQLLGGWLLNARRVSVPPMLRHVRERRNEIRRRRAILPQDLREGPTFSMDLAWWYPPAYEPYPRRHSGLLGYDDDALPDAPQQVQWLPQQEKEEEMEVSIEEYMPPGISEEEAIKMAIEDSEFFVYMTSPIVFGGRG